MTWLGDEIEPAAAGARAPRCVKDLVEERLFDRWRDLFTDLSVVFMDIRIASSVAPHPGLSSTSQERWSPSFVGTEPFLVGPRGAKLFIRR